MDLVKPWLVSHAVKELGQVLQWREQGENLSLPGGEAGGSVFEDDGKTIKIKPTKVGQTAQLIKFGKSPSLIEATLSDSKTRIPITFDSAATKEYQTQNGQPVTTGTLGAVIQIQEYEIRATAMGPRSDRLSLYVTKFKILGANGSGIFGEVPRGIDSEENVRGLLVKLASQWQKREQLDSAESTRRSSFNSNQNKSPVKDGRSLNEGHSLAESAIFATQMPRIPSGLSTEILRGREDLAENLDHTREELSPPNNADLIRGFQRRQSKQPSPAASSPTFSERYRGSNQEITSADDEPSQLVKVSQSAAVPMPESHIQANGKSRQEAHRSTSSSRPQRSVSSPRDKGAANSSSVNGRSAPAIVPAKRKRRERVSARDVKIHKDQENLLARPDSWLPAEPGQREPMANIPIQILNELNHDADSRSGLSKRSGSPLAFEHRQRGVSHVQDVASQASISEDDEKLEWGSSPIRQAPEDLPIDSSRPGSSQSNRFLTKQIFGLSNLEAFSDGYPASSFQGHTKNGSASIASSPQPTQSSHSPSLNGGSPKVISTTDKADNAIHQHRTQGSMSDDERLPNSCKIASSKSYDHSDMVQSQDGHHFSNDNRMKSDHDIPSSVGSVVSAPQTHGAELESFNIASESRSLPQNLQMHSHKHIKLANSQSVASPASSDSDIEISIPHPMEESESYFEQASSPIEIPSTADQAQIPFTQVKRTPYTNGLISRTESTSVEHPTSSGTQDVSRISGTSLGDSNILSSARSEDAAAAVIARDAELELALRTGEAPSGGTQSEDRVKDLGAIGMRNLQTNSEDSAAEEPQLQGMVEGLHSDIDASNTHDHEPLKLQDEELSPKHEVTQGSTKRKDYFADVPLSRTSKRAKLSDFLPEHLSQEDAGSTNLRNLVDRHRKEFFTSRRSSASSAQVPNPVSPAKFAGSTLPSMLSNAEKHRPITKPDDGSTQRVSNMRESSNAAPETANTTIIDPKAVVEQDREDGLMNETPDLPSKELAKQHFDIAETQGSPKDSSELGEQHANVAETQGSPKDSSELGEQHPNVAVAQSSPKDASNAQATDDNNDQTSPKQQNSTAGSPPPAPKSVVQPESDPIAPVVPGSKSEHSEESGSTTKPGHFIEEKEPTVVSKAPTNLKGGTEASPDRVGQRLEPINPSANLQMQGLQNTSPSHTEKGPENQDSINQPKNEDHQSIFELFGASYPSYKGNQKHFRSMCSRIKKLMVDGGCPHQYLWDDFIIRQKTDYSLYVQRCTEEAEDPVSYEHYYSTAIEEPLHTKKVVTVRNLHEGLPEQSEKSLSDRHGHQSAFLPRIGASSTWSETSSLDSREPMNLPKMVLSTTAQGKVTSPLANKSFTFGKPQTTTSPPSRVISPPRTRRIPTERQEAPNVTIDLTMDDDEPPPTLAVSQSETVRKTGQPAKIRRSLPWSSTGTPSRTQAASYDPGQSLDKRRTPQTPRQAFNSSRFGKDRQHEVMDVESTRAPLVDSLVGKGKEPGTQRTTIDTLSHTGASRSLVSDNDGLNTRFNDSLGPRSGEDARSQEQRQGWWRDPDTPYNKFVRDMTAIQPGRGNSYASPDNVRRGKAIQKQRQLTLKYVSMAELGL